MTEKTLIADLRHQHQAYIWWHQKMAHHNISLLLSLAINHSCDMIAYSAKEPHIAMIKLQWWYDKIESADNVMGHPLLEYNNMLSDEYRHALCRRIEKTGDLLERSNKEITWDSWQKLLIEKEVDFWRIIYPKNDDYIANIALFLFLYELPLVCQNQQFDFLHIDICNPYQHHLWQDSVKQMVEGLDCASEDAITSYIMLQKQHWQTLNYHIWQPTWRNLPILSLLKYQFMC